MPKLHKRSIRRSKKNLLGRRKRSSRTGGCGEMGGCMLIPHANNTTASDTYGMAGGGWYNNQLDSGVAVFPANFNNVPIRSFYSYNDSTGDPNQYVVSARNVVGGKNKKRSSRRKRKVVNRCKSCGRTPMYMKGGDGNMSMMNGLGNWTSYIPNAFMPGGLSLNSVNAIGDTTGISNISAKLTTNSLQDPTTSTSSLYHSKNVPLA